MAKTAVRPTSSSLLTIRGIFTPATLPDVQSRTCSGRSGCERLAESEPLGRSKMNRRDGSEGLESLMIKIEEIGCL